MLDLIPAQQPIKNQHQILWCGYQHVITSRPITALVFTRRPAFFCLGVNALVRTKRDGKNVRLGLFTPKTHVLSAAEILLRIYHNPMHLNGNRWRTRFWRQREVRRRKTVVRHRAPFKCMGF